MDFGDYVRAKLRENSSSQVTGIVVCRLAGGVGVLTMDPQSGGPGVLHCCLRRGARVLDVYGYAEEESARRIDAVTRSFIRHIRCQLGDGWKNGTINQAPDLVEFGIIMPDDEHVLKTPRSILKDRSGDLLNYRLPGCYGSGKRR